MNYTLHERMAILKTLISLAVSDGHADYQESSTIDTFVAQMGSSMEEVELGWKMDDMEAAGILHNMSQTKRIHTFLMARKVAQADGFFHQNEEEYLKVLAELLEIDFRNIII